MRQPDQGLLPIPALRRTERESCMAMAMLTWLIAVPLLGVVTGMRSMTAMAVLCWFAYRGDLSLDGTWAFWAAKLVTAIVFTVLALGELVADKLPKAANRTAPGPLIVRVIFGGLVGAIVAAGLNGSEFEGVILGMIGALIGCLWRILDSPRDCVAAGLQGFPGGFGRRRQCHRFRGTCDGGCYWIATPVLVDHDGRRFAFCALRQRWAFRRRGY